MTVLVDTRSLSAADSADAILDALVSAQSVPTTVVIGQGAQSVIEGWQFSAGVNLLNTMTSAALYMKRTTRQLRVAAPERISLAVNLRGTCQSAHVDREVLQENDLQLLDLTSVYEARWTGPNAAVGFLADYTDLGLPVDLVRAAVPGLHSSPLYGLTLQHLQDLPGIARRTPPGPALSMLGAGTVDLVRALVASIVPDNPHSRAGRAESLRTVVLAYIDANLHDPALTLERVASQHGISRRYLYKLFEGEAESPAEAIMRRRLEGARRDLAGHRTLVAAVARRWGFTDPRHFARRFRAAYGVAPSDWARRHLGDT
ncbi:AraC family transcriptional regulator [Dactylosporangium sp. AC04546]|uniref:helix-turn-helix domain-containing protein n=1 Tax=Dactylosporangium sp. AC04546 TaxID=2862460 RepID=UPI001EDEC596|nr:AraC family transcriptional regulator [Dactylosporangium sp. AC04546]WVK88624.1 AraC family transcriptional regulator [Dactylosporangium sp. AC04546]